MSNLPIFDIAIIIVYLLAMVAVGFYFSKRNKNSVQFTSASGKIPGWAIGLSIYATFLSSNTFLGVPGKAFGSNWNAFVFSLSLIHISEPTRLLSISYAVFCLKK